MSIYGNPVERDDALVLRSCPNVRELGGHASPWGTTAQHRFLRAGSTRSITERDLGALREWGVTHVLDLRSKTELPRQTCRLSSQEWVRWENVPLYDFDLSSPTMVPVRDAGGYLTHGYLHMLSSQAALRQAFAFFASCPPSQCVLYHCAAGIDRTGVISMLLLGLAQVCRREIVADYGCSFAEAGDIDRMLDEQGNPLRGRTTSTHLHTRLEVIGTVYDTVMETHGTVQAYLASCGIPANVIDAVRARLLT